MDKSPFQNEDTSSVEPNKFEANNTVVIKEKSIDVHSSSPKKAMSDSVKDKEQLSSDEQPLDENWLLLSQDWQTQPYEKTDVSALLRQTKKRTLLAKSLLALDVLATLALVVALLVGLYQGDWGTATIAYLTFGSIGSLVFVYYEIKIRLYLWQHCCDSPDKAVANAISGIESSIRYIKLTKLSCYFLLPAVNWYLYAMIAESEKSPWLSFIVINSFIIGMWLLTHWFHLKRNKELSQLRLV
jgi:hypothetical protein